MKDPFELATFFPFVKDIKLAALRKQQAACNRKKRRLNRTRLIQMYGGCCVHCGFSDIRALHIDHVNGGGTKERRAFSDLRAYYDHLLTSEEVGKYQVLCANCNAIKRIKNSEHGSNQ